MPDHWVQMVHDPFLRELLALDPGDEVAAADLRDRYCKTCRWAAGAGRDPAEACAREYCDMRDPEVLADVREWVREQLAHFSGIRPRPADDPYVHELIKDLGWRASARLTLGLTSGGSLTWAVGTPNLRALAEAGVIHKITGQDGMVVFSARETTGEEAAKLVVEINKDHALRDKAIVCVWHQEGKSTRAIAREMGWGEDRTRVNEILYEFRLKVRPPKPTRS